MVAEVSAGNPTIQVKGARELARGLKQAGADLKDLRAVNKQAAGVVVPEAKRRVPARTGRLANSIRAGATQKAGVVRAGSKRIPYAGPINYGWPKRNIKPTHFMNDAAEATRPQWVQVYADAVQKIIDRIATGDISK